MPSGGGNSSKKPTPPVIFIAGPIVFTAAGEAVISNQI